MAIFDDATGRPRNKFGWVIADAEKLPCTNGFIPDAEFDPFIDYVFECYKGKYPKPKIIKATLQYLKAVEFFNDTKLTWGGGDSIDRERVQLILDKKKEI